MISDPLARALREVVHEATASISTVLLAVTTVRDASIPTALAGELLGDAEHDTRRLAAHLAAIGPLVEAITDHATPLAPLDLRAALRRAARDAVPRGADVQVAGRGPALAMARAGAVTAALPALLVLGAGGRPSTAVLSIAADEVRLSVAPGAAAVAPRGALARHLVLAMGGWLVEPPPAGEQDAICCRFRRPAPVSA